MSKIETGESVPRVTLHVSVWVEIVGRRHKDYNRVVTLHVSVWVEITLRWFFLKAPASRSTWACELKSSQCTSVSYRPCHAPRERVSWNVWTIWHWQQPAVTLHVSVWVEIRPVLISLLTSLSHAPRERVSWNVYLVCNVYLCLSHAPRERVSWNYAIPAYCHVGCCHAPRERVSWNLRQLFCQVSWCPVTLHVSVWVEISALRKATAKQQSRSTWACELKSTSIRQHRA